MSRSGDTYYRNSTTKETTWDLPAVALAAVTGIALREVDRSGSMQNAKDTARVFGRTGQWSEWRGGHQKPVPGLTDDSVLTLTLDCDAGTFAVAVDGEPKPELTFSEGIVGKTWIPVAGCNGSGGSVTLVGPGDDCVSLCIKAGEAMLRGAGEAGRLDYPKVLMETLASFKRAGADGILTYGAVDAANYLKSS